MRVVYSAQEIEHATIQLAERINSDYKSRQIHLVGVLKGAFVFLADLARRLSVPCSIDFVRLASYGTSTQSSGEVKEVLGLTDSLEGRDVLVVEEIVDSGLTLSTLLARIREQQPASLRVCALVNKTGRRCANIPVDYYGFQYEDGFLVGYGLDANERLRNLPDIHVLDEGESAPDHL